MAEADNVESATAARLRRCVLIGCRVIVAWDNDAERVTGSPLCNGVSS
jgi:hypothetical protein